MSQTNLSNETSSSPSESEEESKSLSTINKHFDQSTTSSAPTAVEEESHQARMKTLREQLDYLKNTEWKYEPIEKYIGQAP